MVEVVFRCEKCKKAVFELRAAALQSENRMTIENTHW